MVSSVDMQSGNFQVVFFICCATDIRDTDLLREDRSKAGPVTELEAREPVPDVEEVASA